MSVLRRPTEVWDVTATAPSADLRKRPRAHQAWHGRFRLPLTPAVRTAVGVAVGALVVAVPAPASGAGPGQDYWTADFIIRQNKKNLRQGRPNKSTGQLSRGQSQPRTGNTSRQRSASASAWAEKMPTKWAWYPVGDTVADLFGDPLAVGVPDDAADELGVDSLYYNQGVYYKPVTTRWVVVRAPPGTEIPFLPLGYTALTVDSDQYFYYQGDFYDHPGDYRVARAPIGATVPYVPDAAARTTEEGESYLEYGGVRYEAVIQAGETVYEVTSS